MVEKSGDQSLNVELLCMLDSGTWLSRRREVRSSSVREVGQKGYVLTFAARHGILCAKTR